MTYNSDAFLKEKLVILSQNEQNEMFELIGSIRDLFSSAYVTTEVASRDVVNGLWDSLFRVFIDNEIYDNQFDAISTMNDIYIYAQRNKFNLNIEPLRSWRTLHDIDNTSSEILECVDEILG